MTWRSTLIKKKVMLEGSFHFVDSTEDATPDKCMHFSTYVRPELISTTPGLLDDLGREFAKSLDPSVDCIVGVGIESMALATAIATQIDLPVCFLSNQFRFRQSFMPTLHNATTVLVATSIVGSNIISQSYKSVRAAKAKVAEVATVWDTSDIKHKLKVISLVTESNQKRTLEGCLSRGPCSRRNPIKRQPGRGVELEEMYDRGELELPEGATLKFVD